MIASLNAADAKKDRLVEITVDGKIDNDKELKDFIAIEETMDKISMAVDSLRLWMEQMLHNGMIDADKYYMIRENSKK